MNNSKEERQQRIKEKKALKNELISNGSFDEFRKKIKEMYNNNLEGIEINVDPQYVPILEELLYSTKRKKSGFRRHTNFMYHNYENLGFVTLTFSEDKINLGFEYMKEIVADVLGSCFEDYHGKFEISPNGRIHYHAIACWNGFVEYDLVHNYKAKRVRNKGDLIQKWYGSKNKQKYGICELILIDKTMSNNANKASNYIMKNLNTMESYITKEEEFESGVEIDRDLLMKVNSSNLMVKRNTPYQKWKKDFDSCMKIIKRKCRVFDTTYYKQYMYSGNEPFIQWFNDNRNSKPIDYLNMFDSDFDIPRQEDYVAMVIAKEVGDNALGISPAHISNELNIRPKKGSKKKKEKEGVLFRGLNEAVNDKPKNRLINESRPPINLAISVSG